MMYIKPIEQMIELNWTCTLDCIEERTDGKWNDRMKPLGYIDE